MQMTSNFRERIELNPFDEILHSAHSAQIDCAEPAF